MKRIIIFLFAVTSSFTLRTQDPGGSYNPYVNQGIMTISKFLTAGEDVTGVASFNIGNTGSDPLDIFTDEFITLTITLSDGVPANDSPLDALGGTYADLFSWSYDNGVFTGIQTESIPASSRGSITIDYKAIERSEAPGTNGFEVLIATAAYQSASNSSNDDKVSSYTYISFWDFGDAPERYASADHILDFENFLGKIWDGEASARSSEEADGDDVSETNDEDGVTFPEKIELGEEAIIDVEVTGAGLLNAWFDWNNNGDFEDPGEKVIDSEVQFTGTAAYTIQVPFTVDISSPVFTRFRFSPEVIHSSSGSSYGGEVEDYMIHVLASPNAPLSPEGLGIRDLSDDSVTFFWDASVDEAGIDYYKIYRDGQLLTTTSELEIIDKSIIVANTYTYTVAAVNVNGLESTQSAVFVVYIDDTTPPTVPGSFSVASVTVSSVVLTWEASDDNLGVTGYRVYRDGSLLNTISELTYTDYAVSLDNSFSYTITAIDEAGNESMNTETQAVTVEDIDAPSIPQGLITTAVSDEEVSITWEASNDNVRVAQYKLYRNAEYLATVEGGLSFTDQSVIEGESYIYKLTAVDQSGNESDFSEELLVIATFMEGHRIHDLSIFPNPSKGHLELDMGDESGRFTLEVVASDGSLLIQKTIDLNGRLLDMDLGSYEPATYHIRIYCDDTSYYGRLILVD